MHHDHYNAALSVVRHLTKAGHTAYFAGGWVRDFLLRHPSDDIDIATSAPVEAIQALFPKTIPVGIAFGIIIVVFEGHSFEVATFRSDLDYIDGRRPTGYVAASAEEDAQRRDFTINGMFYDPHHERVLDYVGGRADLEAGTIRAIGKAETRFAEDRLRMIRAIRYASRFGFAIEDETAAAIQSHAQDLFPSVAIERVWNELVKMGPLRGPLVMLAEYGLLGVIFPELAALPPSDIAERCRPLDRFPQHAPPIALILELFPNASAKERLDLCLYLKLSRADQAFVEAYTTILPYIRGELQWGKREWAHAYANPHFETLLAIHLAHIDHPEPAQKHHADVMHALAEPIRRIREGDPLVTAGHLAERGVEPGPEMGRLLKEAERLSIEEGLQTPDAVIRRLLTNW